MLGHFTRDVLPDGTTTPGGTSLYAALTAHRLGRNVGVVSAPAELPAGWPDAIQIVFHPSPAPPTFENRYTPEGREQTLHTASQPITLEVIPETWRTAPLIHLGPVLGETPEQLVDAFPNALLGVTPQGWMRTWNEPLPGPVLYRPWQPTPRVLERIDALVLSIEDVRGDEALVAGYARHCALVALTRGAQGSTLFLRGVPHHIPAFPAIERDPTGAGDVFAAALLDTPTRDWRSARCCALRIVCRRAQRRGCRYQPHPCARRDRARADDAGAGSRKPRSAASR